MRATSIRARLVEMAFWLGATLGASLPNWLRKLTGYGQCIEVLCEEPLRLTVISQGKTRRWDLASAPRRWLRKALLIPSKELILERELRLPWQTMADLDKVARLELPLSTPFRADEVILAARKKERVGNIITVDVAFIPKKELEPWLRKFRERNFIPTQVSFGSGLIAFIDSKTEERARANIRFDGLLLIVNLLVAILLYSLSSTKLDREIADLKGATKQAILRVETVANLKAQKSNLVETQRAIDAARSGAISPRAVITAMASALPPSIRLRTVSLDLRSVEVILAGTDAAGVEDHGRELATALFEPESIKFEVLDEPNTVKISGQWRVTDSATP